MNINKAFIAQFYIMLGFIFKNKEEAFSKLSWKVICSLILSYAGLAVLSMVIFPGEYIDVNRNMYPNVPYYIVLITIGILTIFTLAERFDFKSKVLVFIGQNTLVIYSMHADGFAIIRKVFSMVSIPLPQNWLSAVLLTVVSTIGCGIGAMILNKVLPEAVGRQRKKKVRF